MIIKVEELGSWVRPSVVNRGSDPDSYFLKFKLIKKCIDLWKKFYYSLIINM